MIFCLEQKKMHRSPAAIPKCKACNIMDATYHEKIRKFNQYCHRCICSVPGCPRRAVNFQRCAEHKATSICKKCNKRTFTSGFCCKTCLETIPACRAFGCKLKVIINKATNEYMNFCQRCKCKTFSCNNMQDEFSEFCNDCSLQKKVKKQRERPVCQTQECGAQTGYYQDKDGTYQAFLFCKKCVCSTFKCISKKGILGFYCDSCTLQYPGVCGARNCSKPCYGPTCDSCNVAQISNLIRCSTIGCEEYMPNKMHIFNCPKCSRVN